MSQTTSDNPAPPAGHTGSAAVQQVAMADDGNASLLDGIETTGDVATAPKPLSERIPEKYRVNGSDGELDEAASMAKLMDGYDHLSKKLGSAAEGPPATPAEYKVELLNAEGKPREDIDFEQFTGDPMFQEFAKGAHDEGLTNKQLNWVVGRYLDVAPQLVAADAQLSLDEAKAELQKLWPEESAFKSGLASAMRAMKGYGAPASDVPGSHERLMAKYGRDPDFLAFASAIGSEMREDRSAALDSVGGVGEGDIEALQKSEAYWKQSHPDHSKTVAKVKEFYTRKYGTAKR